MNQIPLTIALLLFCMVGHAQTFIELGSNDQASAQSSRQFLPTTFPAARAQFLLSEAELRTAGLHAGAEIIGVQWFVAADNTPATTSYDAYLSDDYLSATLPTSATFATDALTQVGVNIQDTGSYVGWHTATFTTSQIWDGTDNMLLQICRAGATQAGIDSIAVFTGNGLSLTSINPLTVIGFNSACTATSGDHSTGSRPYLRLIVNCTPSSSTISATACGTYVAPSGRLYTTSGTYVDTIANSGGCDSVITINLTLQASSTGAANLLIDSSITCVAGNDGVISAVINTSGALLISEAFLGATDYLEITNISTDSLDVTGYYVATSNSYTDINNVNVLTWDLTGKMASGAADYREDATGTNYWGNNLFYNPGSPGWILLFDNNDNIIDALFWEWDNADLANFNPVIKGNTVSVGTQWLGNGVNSAGCTNSLSRSLAVDNSAANDWACLTSTKGINNISGTAITTTIVSTSWNTGDTTLTINNLMAGTYIFTSVDTLGCTYLDTLLLADATPDTSTITISSCGNYTSPSGAVYTMTGTYLDTIVSATGCDSIITINLTTGVTPAVTINPVVCDSYTSPSGLLYTISGVYNDTIPSIGGCDSALVINLTVNNSTSSTIAPTACGTYVSPSGRRYTNSGTYLDTIPNMVGCDSVITINLTIELFSTGAATLTIDNSIACVGGSNGVITATLNSSGSLLISEVDLGGPDFIEITNVASDSIDVTGYYVATSNSYTVINTANSLTWDLTGKLAGGAADYREDATGTNYWGNNLLYNPGSPGWVLLFDNNDNVVDALFWGWSSADIATFSPTIKGNVVSLGMEWLGDGVAATCTNNTLTRPLVADNNDLNDWSCLTGTKGGNNIVGTVAVGNISSTTWNTGDTSLSINNLMAGTYILTSLDTLGCTFLDTIVLADGLPITSTIVVASCATYTSPSGAVYTMSGTYLDTVPSTFGCDSVITINLTINNATTASISPTACNNYISPSGAIYTATGTYLDTIANTLGCDSVITVNLTINNTTAIISPVACNNYTSPSGNIYTASGTYLDTIANPGGCDSIITINLTLNSTASTISIASCGDYTSPSGNLYTMTGTYTDTIANTLGCDSVITINLSITNVDTTVTLSGIVLSSAATNATYQWIDCATNLPLAGMTMQSLTPPANGDYAVIVTQNGCTDTSSCTNVTVIGVQQLANEETIKLYPNPTDGLVTMELHLDYEEALVQVYNATGKRVFQQTFDQQQQVQLNLEEQPAGSYWVSILVADQQQTFLVIKQ